MKIAMTGDENVGKEELQEHYLGKSLNSPLIKTIGANFSLKELDIDGKEVKFQIWSVNGNQRFKYERRAFYLGALSQIHVFDVTRPETFENTKMWVDEVWENNGNGVIPLVLYGNRANLRDKFPNSVTRTQAEDCASKLSERTILNGFNVEYVESGTRPEESIVNALTGLGKTYFDAVLQKKKNGAPTVSSPLEKKINVMEFSEEELELVGASKDDFVVSAEKLSQLEITILTPVYNMLDGIGMDFAKIYAIVQAEPPRTKTGADFFNRYTSGIKDLVSKLDGFNKSLKGFESLPGREYNGLKDESRRLCDTAVFYFKRLGDINRVLDNLAGGDDSEVCELKNAFKELSIAGFSKFDEALSRLKLVLDIKKVS